MIGKIDGREIAKIIEEKLGLVEKDLRLEIFLVGEEEASETFARKKIEMCEKVGFEAELEKFEEEVEEEELLEEIDRANSSPEIDGILVQLPLPDHISEERAFSRIDPSKDVDCLTPERMGAMIRGDSDFRPAAVSAIRDILEHEEFDPEGKNCVIINNSNLIGKPLSMYLADQNATVTICNKETPQLEKHVKGAELVVTATGRKGLIQPEMIPDRCLVIDAGYSEGEGDIEEVEKVAQKARIAPVPGGIGPVTVAATLRNLIKLSES